jgi:hypothetical protein
MLRLRMISSYRLQSSTQKVSGYLSKRGNDTHAQNNVMAATELLLYYYYYLIKFNVYTEP